VGARHAAARLSEEADGGEHLYARTAADRVDGAVVRPAIAAIFLPVLRLEAAWSGGGRRWRAFPRQEC
jgi:hypothetical protein